MCWWTKHKIVTTESLQQWYQETIKQELDVVHKQLQECHAALSKILKKKGGK